MREAFPCRECSAAVRVAELPTGAFVLLNAVPMSDGTGQRFALAGPGCVVPTIDTVAFRLHHCGGGPTVARQGAAGH